MAGVKYGGGIVQMSGKLGGTVFARNSGGNYARAFVKPINPNTARQITVRAALAFIVARWSATLTAVQRTAWNLYASSVAMPGKFGETIFISGFNHYVRSNAIRKQTGQPIIDDGPVVFELPAHDPTLTITASEATQIVSFAFDTAMDWSVEDGGKLFLFQGKPQNAQVNFFDGPWRGCGVRSGVDPGGAASPYDRPAVYAIAEGQALWAYCRISRADGRLSEPFRHDCLVGA